MTSQLFNDLHFLLCKIKRFYPNKNIFDYHENKNLRLTLKKRTQKSRKHLMPDVEMVFSVND